MKTILRDTIEKFRNHLELLWEDIRLEQEGHTLAFYFDTAHLQRAALGYKDYYRDDDTFKEEKFNSDITLVCSLVSGGFLGPFRLLPPHQNEFLDKIKTRFGGVTYEGWRDEARAFVAHARLDLNPDDFLSRLHTSSDAELIERYTEHADMTKRGLNVSHCLLPWDRRLAAWQRKQLLVTDAVKPDYDAVFSSETFETLKSALDRKRTFKISNFIDATALTLLMDETRAFRKGDSKRAPRFFMPESKYDYLRAVLKETGLISELNYASVLGRPSTVLRNEEYFFYRAFFRRRRHAGGGDAPTEWGSHIKELYDKASDILDTSTSVEHVNFEDKPLQDVIDEMENFSFLKNVWIEFINSGDLREILGDLEEIRVQFEEARQSYANMSFAGRVQAALLKTRQDIFDNLDEVKQASVVWDKIDSKVTALRKKLDGSSWDKDALFRNRKLFRYGFPDKYHAEIKDCLSDLLSLEIEPSQKAISRVVSHYLRVRAPGPDGPDRRSLTIVTAVFCALELRDRLRTLLSDLRGKKFSLDYSLLIALAGAELDLNNSEHGERLIDELMRLYYAEETAPADRCNLAIGLTYLHYYAWLARKRAVERRGARQQAEGQKDGKDGDDVRHLINNAVVFAERAASLVGGKELAQKVYVYNQHLFCLVESENPENNRKMREAAAKLREYMNQPDVWSYMYYDTLARYFRWRAQEEGDRARREAFMEKALALSDDAKTAAPHDDEIKNFHTKLIDESDSPDGK